MIVALSGLVTFVGIYSILRRFFGYGVTFATLTLLFLGTNFFLLVVYSGAVQASLLLGLGSLVFWMTVNWYERPGWIFSLLIGIATGIMFFIKPAGIAFLILFIFWGAYNRDGFIMKGRLWRTNLTKVLAVFFLTASGIILRILFPQAFEGTMFCDYIQHQKALNFLAPDIWVVLFSIKNGWIIYTPLVLFSIPGFYLLAEKNKPAFYGTFLFCLSFLLILASSPNVTRPDNFGQSRMTEIYPVLLLPLAYFISWIFEGNRIRKVFFGLLMACCLALNLFQIWQYRTKILVPWFTTSEYFKAVFLKTSVSASTRTLMEYFSIDEDTFLSNEGDFRTRTLTYLGFEDKPGACGGHVDGSRAMYGQTCFRLDNDQRATPPYISTVGELGVKGVFGIKVSAYVYSEIPFDQNPLSLIVTLKHGDQLYHYKPLVFNDAKFKTGKWNLAVLSYVLRRMPPPEDQIITHFWYTGNSRVFVDDVKVELYEMKDQ